MAKLIVSLDGSVIRDYPIDKERVTIGRKPHNDIQIENLAVSGEHACIVTILNDSFLEDLGSTNGTVVNGNPVKKHILQSNDVIEIGKYKLKFVSDAPAAGRTTIDEFEKTMVMRAPALAKAVTAQSTAGAMASGPRTMGMPTMPPPTPRPTLHPPPFPAGGAAASGPLTSPGGKEAAASGPPTSPGGKEAAASGSMTSPGGKEAAASGSMTSPGGKQAGASGPLSSTGVAVASVPGPAPAPEPSAKAASDAAPSTSTGGSASAAGSAPAPAAPAEPALGAIQILSGSGAGKELDLVKNLTTLGKPGVQVAVITRRPQGYFITHVEGASAPEVNGKALDAQACLLKDHDVIELAGVKMEFFLKK
jgi:predicted component of type VI protein secretion system